MKTHSKIIDRIIEGIREHQTFCIVGHIRPDGDCVGSQLGLTLALKAEGKKVVCWNEDPMPEKYAFLDPDKLFQKPGTDRPFDCVIATDAASRRDPRCCRPCSATMAGSGGWTASRPTPSVRRAARPRCSSRSSR